MNVKEKFKTLYFSQSFYNNLKKFNIVKKLVLKKVHIYLNTCPINVHYVKNFQVIYLLHNVQHKMNN
jgi:hypothetical protein